MNSVPNFEEEHANNETSGGAPARALRILDLVSSHGGAMSLAEIAEALSLPKGSAHRLCTLLVSMGYLARDVDDRSYAVGKALQRLALSTLKHRSIQSLRHDMPTNYTEMTGPRIRT